MSRVISDATQRMALTLGTEFIIRRPVILTGIEAAFYDGYRDGRDLSMPEAGPNQHPAYRHSWEVGRAEKEGWPIPVEWSRKRAAHIETGGDFYPYPRSSIA